MRSFVNVHRHFKLDKKHILTYIHIGQMDLKVKKKSILTKKDPFLRSKMA